MMDSHLHTECSFDCVPGCSDGLGEWAMALGLSGFTVTDHLEIGVGQPVRFRQNLLDSLDYVRGLQKRFPMMDIGFGAELGQPHHDLREAAEAVSGLPLDFILASCHLVRGQPDFCDMAPGSYDPDALLEQYFREVLELGYRCLIKTLDRRVLPRHLLGRVMDRAMVEEMTACGVDVCGENGEFHTIAVDGPVFHRPVPYCVRQLLDLGDYSVADITVPEKE